MASPKVRKTPSMIIIRKYEYEDESILAEKLKFVFASWTDKLQMKDQMKETRKDANNEFSGSAHPSISKTVS